MRTVAVLAWCSVVVWLGSAPSALGSTEFVWDRAAGGEWSEPSYWAKPPGT
jgi:hypothetical protein